VTRASSEESMTKLLIVITALSVLAGGTASAETGTMRGGPGTPAEPHSGARVDNPWFPLTPGTIFVYRGVKDGKRARDVVTVTRRTRVVAGVPCRVVEDRLYLDGRLAQRTTDSYAQDEAGNVWYYGEQTAELDRHGHVTSTEGSWRAGEDGAKPGIFMPARPRVGQAYRQELYPDHAEDHFRIIGLFRGTVRPRTASTLLTEEWTPLEPGVLDHKLYVRGIGTVVERSVTGGNEYLELASLRRST
jgi:hypothetical protein